eukprot:4142916-Pyramimonas_sp.AAC.1
MGCLRTEASERMSAPFHRSILIGCAHVQWDCAPGNVPCPVGLQSSSRAEGHLPDAGAELPGRLVLSTATPTQV